MASSSKTPAEQLAERLLPGWTAVSRGEDPRAPGAIGETTARPDRTLPPINRLKALSRATRGPAATAAEVPAATPGEPAPDDAEIVRLENGPLRKTVAVSPSAGKVLWSQG